MRTLIPLLIALFLLATTTLAAQSATSFCKCVCAGNSTIIALNPRSSTSKTQHSSLKLSRSLTPRDEDSETEQQRQDQQKHHTPTCADCNRAFCLDQGVKICEDVKEEEIFASCFQRDSLKDELVVILFLACTGGLLGWALMKPFVLRFRDGGVAGLALPTSSGMSGRGVGADAVGSTGRERTGRGAGTAFRGNGHDLEDDEEPLRPI
ncbi:uncharacterized protein AB675_6955 [Cyphellophora attinorum]|uniref:Uncharacterized protein n=1 Tax=Cyphellophora attinorum TaxID=1664694 RepID=A0A0N1HYH2_9EURO|nr:uncharacterized protein AB675_6955 [Phialophora attinorum]KPI43487.1 hypothetical protein AB675_6955 [Phialophora attinorum]